jgi:RNA recognition motif-containing protein
VAKETKTLYVGNIPYEANEDDMIEFFAAYGAVNARVIEGRGIAFVDIDAERLEDAVLEKHDSEMGQRRLTVNEAQNR